MAFAFATSPPFPVLILDALINQPYNKSQNSEIPGSIMGLLHCSRRHVTIRITRPTSTPTIGNKQTCRNEERLPIPQWNVSPKMLIENIRK